MKINLTQVFRLSAQQVSSTLENETVILDYERGIYYTLDEVGTFIWKMLQQKPMTIAELKSGVLAEYDTDEAICENDIYELLKALLHEKLLEKV
ncbi:PqqD family protein [Runella sp. MFBS21]|uniref:PqqD family protein n=1 Tax=Runella sp. MFBS21 TaxID=3034018 RepID=UPI0023F73C01|nr:PqqD family protein [Runella sp. MFBS21]MDF7817092.1 PqqD family protein [Runella sp. MFBS21]